MPLDDDIKGELPPATGRRGPAGTDAREACFAEWDASPVACGNERSPPSGDEISAARQWEAPTFPQAGALKVNRHHGHDHCAIRRTVQAHSQGAAAQPENGNESSSALGRVWLTVFGLIACFFVFKAAPWSPRSYEAPRTPAAQVTRRSHADARQPDFVPIPIQDVELGRRLAGTNPLRAQTEEIEPDPATWRKISLRMTKANGLTLWVKLLRSLEWLELYDARLDQTIHLELPEMGAVGDALVLEVGPCPPIQPGPGTVVTGKFVHECDGTNVVQLWLEGQSEPTGVTTNHPYWSEDRLAFVPVGELRPGELVNTVSGPRAVESVEPYPYRGLLYNLETTEHVFRVGSLGTLVHNDCLDYAKTVLRRRPNGVIIRMKPLRGMQTGSLPGYPSVGRHGSVRTSFAHHDFHLENGILRDPAHRRGVPIDDWMREYGRLNKLHQGDILDEVTFIPLLGL